MLVKGQRLKTDFEKSASAQTPDKPPVLIAGAFLSESTGIHFVCEDLATRLRLRGWSVVTTSSLKNRGLRLVDMLTTISFARGRYSVALLDVYSGLAFALAEAAAFNLAALRCSYVIVLRSGALNLFRPVLVLK